MFESPLYLMGLPLALIPWLLPTTKPQPANRVDWSALRLIKAAMLRTRKKERNRAFLLRLVRSLLIVGIVLAFARPTLPFSLQKTDGVLLVVGTEQTVDSPLTSAYYLFRAVRALGLPITVCPTGELSAKKASTFRTMMIADADAVTPGQSEIVKQSATNSRVIIFFGRNTDAESWNENFFVGNFLQSVIPLSEENGRQSIEIVQRDSPVVQKLIGVETQTGLATVPMKSIWTTDSKNRNDMTPVLSLSGGIPFLTTMDRHITLFFSSPDETMSRLGVWPCFVTLLGETIAQPIEPIQLRRPLDVVMVFMILGLFLTAEFLWQNSRSKILT